MTKRRIQESKALVWEYWHALNRTPQRAAALAEQYLHQDILWQGPRPIRDIRGRDRVVDEFLTPLLCAIPDLRRDCYLFLGGEFEGGHWVGGGGDYVGTFHADWLGIPATGKAIRMRFGEFCRVDDGVVVEVYTLLDIIDLMAQAGFDVLPPDPGRNLHPPAPESANAVLLQPQDDKQSRQSLRQLEDMLFKGMDYRTRNSRGSMDGYWRADMKWYGPRGIGACYGLDEFRKKAQGTILSGFPDRIGGFHKVRIGEGECAAMGGLKTLQGTHLGEFLGIAPTGNGVAWRIMDFYTLKDGLLHENWVLIDLVDACLQIGVDLFQRLTGRAAESTRRAR